MHTTLPENSEDRSQYDCDGFDAIEHEVDVDSFHVIYDLLARDKFGVYYAVLNEHSERIIEVVDADPYTFEIVNICYAYDKTNVYFIRPYQYLFEVTPSKIDRDSFEVIDNLTCYVKDKNHIYKHDDIVE